MLRRLLNVDLMCQPSRPLLQILFLFLCQGLGLAQDLILAFQFSAHSPLPQAEQRLQALHLFAQQVLARAALLLAQQVLARAALPLAQQVLARAALPLARQVLARAALPLAQQVLARAALPLAQQVLARELPHVLASSFQKFPQIAPLADLFQRLALRLVLARYFLTP